MILIIREFGSIVARSLVHVLPRFLGPYLHLHGALRNIIRLSKKLRGMWTHSSPSVELTEAFLNSRICCIAIPYYLSGTHVRYVGLQDP